MEIISTLSQIYRNKTIILEYLHHGAMCTVLRITEAKLILCFLLSSRAQKLNTVNKVSGRLKVNLLGWIFL